MTPVVQSGADVRVQCNSISTIVPREGLIHEKVAAIYTNETGYWLMKIKKCLKHK